MTDEPEAPEPSILRVHQRIDELERRQQAADAERDKAMLKAVIKWLTIALAITSGFSVYCIRLIQNAAIRWS
jgi:hypothetical protein